MQADTSYGQEPQQTRSARTNQDGAGPSGAVKRLLCAEPLEPSPSRPLPKTLSLGLFVSWHTLGAKSRHNCLTLRRIPCVEDLQGLARDLMTRAFSPGTMPAHLSATSSRLYYHYTPEQECLSLPSDVVRTHLKLIVTYDGWEYVVYERKLRTDPTHQEDDETPLLVTVVEFESTALVIGHLGIRVLLVSYPTVSIRKDFLDDIDYRLRADPENFKGILS
ncbi:hypothetical protein VOLCADRAFT_100437 [Volvox carteri f. nagariensis]|uniref:Uncharacterized protein n=1 Tax=Volvox carteri f. nagariensis TaxID=3068 RepID=D8UK75_VOLCA|nr:uncharacterized protein VOLCADRAFT_100437 [Volvox carteri f. nagariensis]EFJ39877.1 hypothetical protein VOLCADRAFT_100437 [Volvox carteri f. nagariensis]|eukprot:XP_002959054.1 hypothetical protein VOLCADRAFT_100437 [Volvox carteri f. nagariensis]